MSEAAAPALPPSPAATIPARISLARIFLEFLIIGGTSFGGVIPYLRGSLVTKTHWLDDVEFTEMLSICQSLPGLNATNMAILVGEKLRGGPGAVVAILGICLPGAILMYCVGMFYRAHGDHEATWPDPVDGVAAGESTGFSVRDHKPIGPTNDGGVGQQPRVALRELDSD